MADADVTRRVVWLTRWLGVGGLALIGVTWKLWTPQDVFPRVPLLWWAPPHWLDWTALAITLTGLFALVFTHCPTSQPEASARARRYGVINSRVVAAITAIGFALLFLSDQHRLQPWAWQFFILTTVRALADDRTVFYGWRWLVVSIYFWSAVSKFDAAFLNDTGLLFLQKWWGLISEFRLRPTAPPWIPTAVQYARWNVLILPCGELAIAFLLTFRGTRSWGLYGSWLMHLLLLIVLGPSGMNHSWGVLLWNAYFMVQNLPLFRETNTGAQRYSLSRLRELPKYLCGLSGMWRPKIAWAILFVVAVWPATVSTGGCDPWLGWSVYTRSRWQVTLWMDQSTADALPKEIRAATEQYPRVIDRNVWTWRGTQLVIGRWSLHALGAPDYPHRRFDTGVALDLLERGILKEQDMDFVVFGKPNPRPKDGRDAIEAYARTFRLNAFPESYYRREAERASK